MDVNICFSLHDLSGTYSKFVGTAICSIFEHTRAKVKIYILHDDSLNDINKKKFGSSGISVGKKCRFPL